MIILEMILITLCSLGGGVVSRTHGGGFFEDKLSLAAWILAAPIILLGILCAAPIYQTVIAYLAGVFIIRTGHGGWLDMGRWEEAGNTREYERLEFLIKPLHGKIPERLYDFIGMTVNGFLTVAMAFVMLVLNGAILACIPVVIGGMLKGVSYFIGWELGPSFVSHEELDEQTEVAEFLRGFFLTFGLLTGAILI